MFKVNNWNTRTRFEICSKLTRKTPERPHRPWSGKCRLGLSFYSLVQTFRYIVMQILNESYTFWAWWQSILLSKMFKGDTHMTSFLRGWGVRQKWDVTGRGWGLACFLDVQSLFFIKGNWICVMTRHHAEPKINIIDKKSSFWLRRQTVTPSFNDTITLFAD